jgi:hypothetical protein
MVDKLSRKVLPGLSALSALAVLAGPASAQTVGPSGEAATP